jgi:hypothetical protein
VRMLEAEWNRLGEDPDPSPACNQSKEARR